MSPTSTSFIRSTNRLPPPGTLHSARIGAVTRRLDVRHARARRCAKARAHGGRDARRMAVRDGGGEVEAAVRATDRNNGGRHAIGHERGERVVVAKRAARLRKQMHGRIPAAGHADEIAIDSAACAAGRDDIDGLDMACAARPIDDRGGPYREPALAGSCGQLAGALAFAAGIDDRRDLDAGVRQRERASHTPSRCW